MKPIPIEDEAYFLDELPNPISCSVMSARGDDDVKRELAQEFISNMIGLTGIKRKGEDYDLVIKGNIAIFTLKKGEKK